jgi:hypothetical protein
MQEVVIEVLRLDGGTLRIRHAAEMAQVFFRLDPSANGPKSYDACVARSPKDRIVAEDIKAINTTMAAHARLHWWQALIDQAEPAWLTSLDPSWSLFDLTDDSWASLGIEASIANTFSVMFGYGRRLSVVTKVLHMKRPDLIPVCDALVLQQVGAPAGIDDDPAKAAAFIAHLRKEGRCNLPGLRVIQDHLQMEGRTPSLLRIFEALIWQSHPSVWYQKLAPLIAEWLDEKPAEAQQHREP